MGRVEEVLMWVVGIAAAGWLLFLFLFGDMTTPIFKSKKKKQAEAEAKAAAEQKMRAEENRACLDAYFALLEASKAEIPHFRSLLHPALGLIANADMSDSDAGALIANVHDAYFGAVMRSAAASLGIDDQWLAGVIDYAKLDREFLPSDLRSEAQTFLAYAFFYLVKCQNFNAEPPVRLALEVEQMALELIHSESERLRAKPEPDQES